MKMLFTSALLQYPQKEPVSFGFLIKKLNIIMITMPILHISPDTQLHLWDQSHNNKNLSPVRRQEIHNNVNIFEDNHLCLIDRKNWTYGDHLR